MIWRIGLFVLVSLLLAAHFFRQGSGLPTAICLLVPLLFAWRRPWSLVVLQLSAYLGAAIWVVTAVRLVQERLAIGAPWATAAAILGAVAVLTAVSGALLNSRSIRDKYRRPR